MAKRRDKVIDTAETIQIKGSSAQLIGSLGLTLLAGAGIGAAVWINAEILPTGAVIAMILGTLGLVAASVVISRVMFRPNEPLVTISPDGVCDRRISPDTVSWSAVEDVRPTRLRQVPVVELVLAKEASANLTYTPLARLMRSYHRLSRAVRYTVTAHGLKMGHKQLMETLKAYAAAHGAEAS
ncbi:MAG: STM3941 family protein [Pseudomonadota bacterium]